jgi:hypothetical protein
MPHGIGVRTEHSMISEVVIPLGKPDTCQCDASCDGGAYVVAQAIQEARLAGATRFCIAYRKGWQVDRALSAARDMASGRNEQVVAVESLESDWDNVVLDGVRACTGRSVLLLDPMLNLQSDGQPVLRGLQDLQSVSRRRRQTVVATLRLPWEVALDMAVLQSTPNGSAVQLQIDRATSERDGKLTAFAGRAVLNRAAVLEGMPKLNWPQDFHFPFERLLAAVTGPGSNTLTHDLGLRLAKERLHRGQKTSEIFDPFIRLAS